MNSLEVSNMPRGESPFTQIEIANGFSCFRRTNRRVGSVGKDGGADLQFPFLHPQPGTDESPTPFVEKSTESI